MLKCNTSIFHFLPWWKKCFISQLKQKFRRDLIATQSISEISCSVAHYLQSLVKEILSQVKDTTNFMNKINNSKFQKILKALNAKIAGNKIVTSLRQNYCN